MDLTHASFFSGVGGIDIAFERAGTTTVSHSEIEAGETWTEGDVMPTLNSFDVGDVRTTAAIVMPPHVLPDDADALLPLGLDSNRYRAIGNAVAVPVVEWIAHRLTHELTDRDPHTLHEFLLDAQEGGEEDEDIPWV